MKLHTLDIDYYSAFIKAWIAFNSWYRSEYRERTDREIIEKLKSESNRFKGYIETLLDTNNNTDEAISFKKNLNSLRSALVSAAIVTQERGGMNQQISFSEIAINNPKTLAEGDYRVTHYKIQRTRQKVTTLHLGSKKPRQNRGFAEHIFFMFPLWWERMDSNHRSQ